MSYRPIADLAWQVDELLVDDRVRAHFFAECQEYLHLKHEKSWPSPLPFVCDPDDPYELPDEFYGIENRKPLEVCAQYAVLAALHEANLPRRPTVDPAPWPEGANPLTVPRESPMLRNNLAWVVLVSKAKDLKPTNHQLRNLEACLATVKRDSEEWLAKESLSGRTSVRVMSKSRPIGDVIRSLRDLCGIDEGGRKRDPASPAELRHFCQGLRNWIGQRREELLAHGALGSLVEEDFTPEIEAMWIHLTRVAKERAYPPFEAGEYNRSRSVAAVDRVVAWCDGQPLNPSGTAALQQAAKYAGPPKETASLDAETRFDLRSALDALLGFVNKFTHEPLASTGQAELLRLDGIAFALVQQAGLSPPEVPLKYGYSSFGKMKLPYYAQNPAGPVPAPSQDWLCMMGDLQAKAGPTREEERHRKQQEAHAAETKRLQEIIARPCTDARELLAWCTEASRCLAEFVRLSGGDWTKFSGPGQAFARGALSRASTLPTNAETLALLSNQLPADQFIMTAGTARAHLQRLAEWCRGEVSADATTSELPPIEDLRKRRKALNEKEKAANQMRRESAELQEKCERAMSVLWKAVQALRTAKDDPSPTGHSDLVFCYQGVTDKLHEAFAILRLAGRVERLREIDDDQEFDHYWRQVGGERDGTRVDYDYARRVIARGLSGAEKGEIRGYVDEVFVAESIFPRAWQWMTILLDGLAGNLWLAKNEKDQPTNGEVGRSQADGAMSAAPPKSLPSYRVEEQPWFRALPKEQSIAQTDLTDVERQFPILMITAVEVEREALLRRLTPLKARKRILKVHVGQETYVLGRFGAFPVAITMCAKGTSGRDASSLATQHGIAAWNPLAVVMPGIAFGADANGQSIADVLIATHIIPYEIERVSEKEVPRGPQPESGAVLLNRFRHARWEFSRPDGSIAERKFGPLLSGEKLVDDAIYKSGLLNKHPHAIGGEMEGYGVQSASARAKREWIVVKAICDWGDGTKDKKHQPLAAAAAASLVYEVLSDPNALEGLAT